MFSILGWIVFGLIVGALAKLVMPGRDPGGIIVTIVLGIVGAVLGGWLGRAIGLYGPGEPAGFVMALIGAMSHTCWVGAAAHQGVADLAQGLPRRVSSRAERLRGARSNLAAQQREGSVPSGAGRADPSGGGPEPRLGTVSLAHQCAWLERSAGVQAPRLERTAPVDRG